MYMYCIDAYGCYALFIYSKESLEEFPCVYPDSSVLVQKISSLDPATPM